MKKFATILAASFLLIVNTVSAEMAIGVTANFASIETDGTETLRNSSKKTTASSDVEETLPEVFVEIVGDRGVFGVAYIPVQELGNKSRTDSNSEGDSGTYTAKAEVDNVVMFYADVPIGPLYAKFGISRAELVTQESLNSGSTYDNEDVFGYTLGLGKRGDFYGGTFYKAEFAYTNFDSYEDTSSDSEKIMKAVKETERIVEKIIGRNIDIMIEIDFPQRIIFTTRPPSLDVLMKNTDIVRSNKEFIKLQKFISDNKLWGNQRQSTYRLKTDKAVMK